LPWFDRFIRNIRSVRFIFIFYFILLPFHFFSFCLKKKISLPIYKHYAIYCPPTYTSKMAEKDYYRTPILSRDNYKTWFQDMSFKLHGKEIFYVVEITMGKYAWIPRNNSMTTPPSKSGKSSTSVESDIDELTTKFKKLGGTYNLDRKRVFERDQAKAFHIISMSLGNDNKSARGKYKLDIKGF
jgi:hypothetical protein